MPQSIAAIIALYNGRDFIERSLRSVLNQTRPPEDIIIVDDGSTDGGADVARDVANGDSRVRIVRKPNGGQSSARNMGVNSSSSSLIAFLDQDDWWYPTHLEVLARPFAKRRNLPLGWIYSDLDEYDVAGRLIVRNMLRHLGGQHPKRDVHTCLGANMYVLPSASLISREAFTAVGGFDERLAGFEDDDLFLRIFTAGYDNEFVPVALSGWRIHNGSTSYTLRMARSGLIYSKKLLGSFPNDRTRARHYCRDLIAPRFLREALALYARSLRAGADPAAFTLALEQLDAVRSALPLRHRLVIGAVRPAMSSRLVAHTARKVGVLNLFGRFYRGR
jgi:glycosyltransferase involved in cell wall biosynthesis